MVRSTDLSKLFVGSDGLTQEVIKIWNFRSPKFSKLSKMLLSVRRQFSALIVFARDRQAPAG